MSLGSALIVVVSLECRKRLDFLRSTCFVWRVELALGAGASLADPASDSVSDLGPESVSSESESSSISESEPRGI